MKDTPSIPLIILDVQDAIDQPVWNGKSHHLVEQADAWIFGHTHHAVDTEISGCRLVSNPKGYPGERTGFVPDFVLAI